MFDRFQITAQIKCIDYECLKGQRCFPYSPDQSGVIVRARGDGVDAGAIADVVVAGQGHKRIAAKAQVAGPLSPEVLCDVWVECPEEKLLREDSHVVQPKLLKTTEKGGRGKGGSLLEEVLNCLVGFLETGSLSCGNSRRGGHILQTR